MMTKLLPQNTLLTLRPKMLQLKTQIHKSKNPKMPNNQRRLLKKLNLLSKKIHLLKMLKPKLILLTQMMFKRLINLSKRNLLRKPRKKRKPRKRQLPKPQLKQSQIQKLNQKKQKLRRKIIKRSKLSLWLPLEKKYNYIHLRKKK